MCIHPERDWECGNGQGIRRGGRVRNRTREKRILKRGRAEGGVAETVRAGEKRNGLRGQDF